jgi:hypothetical protein
MWALIERLPAEVVGAGVFSMLKLKSLVALDSAFLAKNKRASLHRCFFFVTVSQLWLGRAGRTRIECFLWIIARKMRLRYLLLDGNYGGIIPLIIAHPSAVVGEIQISCFSQVALNELEKALAVIQAESQLQFSLDLSTKWAARTIRHADKLRSHLANMISWNAAYTNISPMSMLIHNNHKLHCVIISHATLQEIELATSLGASLRNLRLKDFEAGDEALTMIGQRCPKLEELCFYPEARESFLHACVTSVASGCTLLRRVSIYCVVSDEAVVELCTRCFVLQELRVPYGYLTSAAIAGLVASHAPLSELWVGWQVTCVAPMRAHAHYLSTLTSLSITTVLRACASTLALALERMTKLDFLSISQEDKGRPFPAESIARLIHSCPLVRAIFLFSQTLRGGHEQMWMQMFTERPALQVAYINVDGLELSDSAIEMLAKNCPRLKKLHFNAARTLTDAGTTVLAAHCAHLTDLSIANGTALTDASLHALAAHCSDLSRVTLSRSTCFTEAAVLHLLQRCPKLSMLDLHALPMDYHAVARIKEALRPRKVSLYCARISNW